MLIDMRIKGVPMKKYTPTSALLGVAIGDALGVPYEFKSRSEMQANPAINMRGFGTHNQPRGTWSDDTSLTLCLAESLLGGYDLADMAHKFVAWYQKAYWTAHNEVFDIGMTTRHSLNQLHDMLEKGQAEDLKYLYVEACEQDNGNGSLMRILPLLWYVKGKPIAEQWQLVWQVSALTHKHIRAGMSCLIYLKFAEYLLQGMDKATAYEKMRAEIMDFWQEMGLIATERQHFRRVIDNDIRDVPIDEIKTGGYVIESLESSIFFLLTEDSYQDTVLAIINLGHDTDTSGAIVGGLAGLYYGLEDIPENWLEQLARKDEIIALGGKFEACYQ